MIMTSFNIMIKDEFFYEKRLFFRYISNTNTKALQSIGITLCSQGPYFHSIGIGSVVGYFPSMTLKHDMR